MMEIGFSKILLIFALALIVLGPDKLPKVAAEVGRWVGRARAMARQFREQLEDEATLDPSIHKRSSTAGTTSNAGVVSNLNAVVESPPVPATEVTPDYAELTPHPPMEDPTAAPLVDPVAEYIGSHPAAATDAAGATDSAPDTRLPRL